MHALLFALITATLPTGSAYIATTGGTCAGALTTTSCRLATVSQKNLWDPEARKSFSLDDLTASLKVTDPAVSVVGTLITQIGGGGTGSAEANTYGTSGFLQPALDAGWRVVQVLWASNSGNGMWLGSPSSSSYGGDGAPDGPLYLAARYAALSKAICDEPTLHTAGQPCVAYGQSGGSSAIAYSLVRYGAGDWLDGAILSGGPPIGDLERGCAGATYPGWITTDCPPLRATSGACFFNTGAVSGPFVDATWNDGRAMCAWQQSAYADLGYQSIFGGAGTRRFRYTTIRVVYGDADGSEAVPLGRFVVRKMTDATGSTPVNIVTTGASAPHAVLDASNGALAVKTMLLGGTYLSTTYTAMAVTRPATSVTWTPESIPGVELWFPAHSLPHLGVEDYATQTLTNPAADGDAVRYVDDPVHGYILAGSTTSGLTLSTSGSISYLKFVRADADFMTIKTESGISALDMLHKTGVFTLLFRIGIAANDGTQQTILDSANATTANAGIYVFRTTSNTLTFQVMRASAGTYVYNCTTTATLRASDGIVPIYAVFGGAASGSQAKIKVGSNAVETCAAAGNTPSTSSANQVMWVGRASGGGNASDLMLADLAIVPAVVNPSDLTQWMSWAPTRTTSSLVRWVGADAGFYNFLSRDYHYRVNDGLYTDSACTTRALVAGDTIGCVRSLNDPDGHLGRGGTQSTAANRPTWRGAASGAQWDGVNDELTLAQTADPRALTWLVVGSNNDATNGSHFFGSGGRILVTGTSYSGNSPAQSPAHANGAAYLTVHPGTGGTCLSDVLYPAAAAFNALEARRDGSNWTLDVLQRTNGTVSPVNQCTASNSNQMHFTHHGTPAIANWDIDGYVKRATEWHVSLTEAQLAPVRRFYCAMYGGC